MAGPATIPPKERPHPLTGESIPATLGHEFCGRVIKAPPGSNLSPGQAIVVDPRLYCRDCSRCATSATHGCRNLGFKGLSGSGGGFSSTVAVDARLCYPLPDSVDLRLAALIEPLAVAWHAVDLCEVADWSEQAVLIAGGGPVGIAHIYVLRAKGCKKIYVSEPTATRAKQNRGIADGVFDPAQEDIVQRCRDVTGGEGVDVVFDCAGVQRAMDAAMGALKFKGLYMNVAGWEKPVRCPRDFVVVFGEKKKKKKKKKKPADRIRARWLFPRFLS